MLSDSESRTFLYRFLPVNFRILGIHQSEKLHLLASVEKGGCAFDVARPLTTVFQYAL